ncbi:DUF3126 family protein [Bartonella sp. DGB1]|uniref:DUF3126 family protein n=1 Tax=Bartonella sp. DGB1 TaxID=3239807 RepID=UPI003525A881
MKVDIIKKLENYLKTTFNNDQIKVKARPMKDDSCEFYIGEEFLGVIYEDKEEDGDISYNLSMAILETDL